MQSITEQIARNAVDRNGGEYTTDVPDLLKLFHRQQLSDPARHEIREALQSVGVGTDPDLLFARREEPIRLFLVRHHWVRTCLTATRGWRVLLRPRSWKGWAAYGAAAAVALSMAIQDPE
jgi:hypothetical protein